MIQEPEPQDATYREAQAVLEGLARAGSSSQHEVGEVVPSASEEAFLEGTKRVVPPAWAEQTLRSLLEALPDALVVIDGEGSIVLVNARTEDLFGYDRGELLGHPVERLVPERFRRTHVGHRTAYLAAPRGRPMGEGLELWGQRKDGSEFPVEISLNPLQTDHGMLVTSVIRDITARKREEAKFRTLVENIPAVTFIAPLDQSVSEFYVSPQIEQLLGFSQKEWLEDPVLWHRQLHPDDKDHWNVEFAPTLATGEPFHLDYRFFAKDGRVVWVRGSALLVRDREGRPLFLQGVAFDVTATKEAEEALSQINAELEKRVEERTEALARSMAELREKTEELERFAYIASHDLREPLRTLVNWPQRLAKRYTYWKRRRYYWLGCLVNWPQRLAKQYAGQFDERAADSLQRIINGAERMRRLIDSLSHYSRALRRDRSLALVDCSQVVAEACGNLQAALEESGVELKVAELPSVMGNQPQLMLLFQNLIGNAVKFRASDRIPRVEVGVQRESEGWLFWVRDNGIGIETKFLKRIFGLGERLHSASKYTGTGFGLAICEKIVAGHGGRIWAESEPEQGSTFSFTLPAKAADPIDSQEKDER